MHNTTNRILFLIGSALPILIMHLLHTTLSPATMAAIMCRRSPSAYFNNARCAHGLDHTQFALQPRDAIFTSLKSTTRYLLLVATAFMTGCNPPDYYDRQFYPSSQPDLVRLAFMQVRCTTFTTWRRPADVGFCVYNWHLQFPLLYIQKVNFVTFSKSYIGFSPANYVYPNHVQFSSPCLFDLKRSLKRLFYVKQLFNRSFHFNLCCIRRNSEHYCSIFQQQWMPFPGYCGPRAPYTIFLDSSNNSSIFFQRAGTVIRTFFVSDRNLQGQAQKPLSHPLRASSRYKYRFHRPDQKLPTSSTPNPVASA